MTRSNPSRKNLDPNATLDMLRSAIERLSARRTIGYKAVDVDVLLDSLQELDEHLSEGGELPADWNIDERDPADDDDDDDDDGYEPVDDEDDDGDVDDDA